MNRRDVIKGCVASVAGAMMHPSFAKSKGNDYSVLVIGDTHYDTLPESVYHSAYPASDVNASLEKCQRGEFVRNGEMWRDRLPRLLDAVKNAKRSDTAFAIQVGDLIQGDCNDSKVHTKMAKDAFDKIRDCIGRDMPLRLVVGNHDIRNGANENVADDYRKWMNGAMTRECGADVTSTNFSYWKDSDLWIHVDFTRPQFDFVREALANSSKARYIFLVTHGPVIPSDNRWYNWILHGYGDHVNRRALRDLLLKHNVIVIAGHTHTVELGEIANEKGCITQIIANSVWKEEAQSKYEAQCNSTKQYGELQTTPAGREYLGEYAPMLKRYERSKCAGFFRLEISDEKVVAHFFGGDAKAPSVSWLLRGK